MLFRASPLFLLAAVLSSANSIQNATNSASFSQLKVDAGVVVATATSSTCVADQTATSIYAGTGTSAPCTFFVSTPGYVYGTITTTYTGQGYTGPKFLANNGVIVTNLNSITGIAVYSPNLANSSAILAGSNAEVQPFLTTNAGIVGYGAQFSISGSVTYSDYTFPCFCTVIAAAQAKDPEVLDFTAPGTHSLNFSYGLGLSPGNASLPQLSFFSVDPAGRNEIDIAASFLGVSYKGQALNGNLFSLTIGADGPITNSSGLSIIFAPWQGLGLSASQILAVDQGIESKLIVNSDGTVGLAPGSSLDIFGDDAGALLPSINFDHPTGIVTYDDATALVSTETPEGSSFGMGMLGVVVLGAICLGRRSGRLAGVNAQASWFRR